MGLVFYWNVNYKTYLIRLTIKCDIDDVSCHSADIVHILNTVF